MDAGDLTSPVVVRFDDLVPGWEEAPHSTEAGFLRWLSVYVGGIPGTLHEFPTSGLVGKRSMIGVMGLPSGQRQYGLHRHTTTEVYVILKGQVEVLGVGGIRGQAGPMDCLYFPVGAPHAVKAHGDEDVLLMYVHDEHEKLGSAEYFVDDDPSLPEDAPAPVIIKWEELEPSRDAPMSRDAGHMREMVNWVGGGDGRLNLNRGVAAENELIALGATDLQSANSIPAENWDTIRYLQIIEGRLRIGGHPDLGQAGKWDVIVVPAGQSPTFEPVGIEPVRLIWFHEDNVGLSA